MVQYLRFGASPAFAGKSGPGATKPLNPSINFSCGIGVPASIGINQFEGYISPVHTHDTTGTIHIEAGNKDTFTLGQFFDVWGVRLTDKCIGGYCTRGADSMQVLSNGVPVRGNPRDLPLQNNEQIEITFGRKALKSPSSR